MSGVVITKCPPVVVAPSETVTATTDGDIRLSFDDKLMGGLAITVLLVFEHAIQDPVETIKRGLSQALVHYYPLAGRFESGGGVIKCTGEGVRFVAASASCAIKDVGALSDRSLQQELALFYPGDDGGRYSDHPLVLMQGTVFSCGGLVLGVTWNHGAADGIGMGQFLQAVGELARGLPGAPSVIPVRQDDSLVLPDLPPYCRDFFQLMNLMGSSIQPSEMSTLDITVEASLVNRIKEKYASINSGRPCTVFEAVAAVLWRCRTRAIRARPEALAVLNFSASVRKQVGAKDGYYGNCVTPRLATASNAAVGNGDVMELVKTIRRAKEGVAPDAQPDLKDLDLYNVLIMSCWRNIGLEAPDLGGGRPARVKCHWGNTKTRPICIACLPCKDEYNVLSLCVREEHAGAFVHELAEMHLNHQQFC